MFFKWVFNIWLKGLYFVKPHMNEFENTSHGFYLRVCGTNTFGISVLLRELSEGH